MLLQALLLVLTLAAIALGLYVLAADTLEAWNVWKDDDDLELRRRNRVGSTGESLGGSLQEPLSPGSATGARLTASKGRPSDPIPFSSERLRKALQVRCR